jgi:uncharacterized protein (TIGR00645 family)
VTAEQAKSLGLLLCAGRDPRRRQAGPGDRPSVVKQADSLASASFATSTRPVVNNPQAFANSRTFFMEKLIEKTLFASRWLLAPIYLGLSLALLALGIKFSQETYHVLSHIWTLSESDLVLTILALIDLVLVGSLVVMVMFSGYENFVSRLDVDPEEAEKLGWLSKLDAGTLKLKVAAFIVAISSIHLFRAFMNAPEIPSDKLMWYMIIHMTFVVSAVLMGVLDKVSFSSHRDH